MILGLIIYFGILDFRLGKFLFFFRDNDFGIKMFFVYVSLEGYIE